MNATKVFLAFNVAVWLPYALYLVVQPSFLDGAAGLVGSTPTGTTEIRAMYGGLQAGIGVLAIIGLTREERVPGVLLTLCCLTGGLFLARLIGLLLDGSGSGYTYGALGFELFNSTVAFLLFQRHSRA